MRCVPSRARASSSARASTRNGYNPAVVLQVPFEQFVSTVERVLEGVREAYVIKHFKHSLITASKGGETVVASMVELKPDEVKKHLKAEGFQAFEGRWTDDVALEHESDVLSDVFIAGVAYKTEGGPPGLWIDAYTAQPTQVQVLKTMYEEFLKTGEMQEVSFEEFVRISEANVVIASPSDLRSFLAQKEGC